MKELFCNTLEELENNLHLFPKTHVFKQSEKYYQEWDFNKNKDINLLKLTGNKKYHLKCTECNSEYQKSPNSTKALMKTKGSNPQRGICNFCYGKETNHTNCVFATHPFAKDYWSSKNTIDPLTIRYTFSKEKTWWNCKDCGYDFHSQTYSVVTSLSKGNSGCPHCRGLQTNPTNNVAHLFPQLIKEWHPTKNKYKLTEVTPSSDKRMYWICEKGHEWNTLVSSRVRFNKSKKQNTKPSGCPYCANYKVKLGYNDIGTLYPHLLSNIVHKEDIAKWNIGSGNKIEWRCDKCDTNIGLKTIKNVITHGLSCALCSDNTPRPERFMTAILKDLDIYFDHNQGFSWSQEKAYDFFLRDYNVIIELHGEQHFKRSKTTVFNTTRTLSEEQENDIFKKQLAKKNGVKHYLEIPCVKTTFTALKEAIENDKKLQDLIPLKDIDWKNVQNLCNIK